MIPSFNKHGCLPPGKHRTTWQEFELRFATNERRQMLMIGLKSALKNLKQAGCRMVYIDGSFVSDNDEPNDWDGCWELEGVDPAKVDPVILYADWFPDRVQKKYLGDLALHTPRLPGRDYINFFQRDKRETKPRAKGIIVIKLETLSCF